MLHTLRFSLQNAVYFIMLHVLFPVLCTIYIQGVLNLNVKLWCQKVKYLDTLNLFIYLFFETCKIIHSNLSTESNFTDECLS